jgi:two-component system response regulator
MEKVVLLVEDNVDDEALILRALRKGGLTPRLVTAHDGLEALDELDKRSAAPPGHGLPDVVLLDINLPKLSGLEVLKRIRKDDRLRRLPVVILTSSREESDVSASYALGATSYVRKPIDSEAFSVAIQKVVDYWLTLNETVPLARTSDR